MYYCVRPDCRNYLRKISYFPDNCPLCNSFLCYKDNLSSGQLSPSYSVPAKLDSLHLHSPPAWQYTPPQQQIKNLIIPDDRFAPVDSYLIDPPVLERDNENINSSAVRIKRRTDNKWVLKSFTDPLSLPVETIAYEALRFLLGNTHPKGRIVFANGEPSAFAAQFVNFKGTLTHYTHNLGKVLTALLFIGEVDIHSGNIGIDANDNTVSIDHLHVGRYFVCANTIKNLPQKPGELGGRINWCCNIHIPDKKGFNSSKNYMLLKAASTPACFFELLGLVCCKDLKIPGTSDTVNKFIDFLIESHINFSEIIFQIPDFLVWLLDNYDKAMACIKKEMNEFFSCNRRYNFDLPKKCVFSGQLRNAERLRDVVCRRLSFLTPDIRAAGRRNWLPDSSSKTCMSCGNRFSICNRRHHCRHCGGLFCDACSLNYRELIRPVDNTMSGRICNLCYDRYYYRLTHLPKIRILNHGE